MSLTAWWKAARPLAHANIAPPIALGVALASAQGGRVGAAALAVAFAFGVFDHLFIVFANDYADRDADAEGEGTLISGGSRVLQEGLIEPTALRAAALAAAAALIVTSVAGAVWLERPFLPAFAAVALVLLHAYSYPPLRLSYRGFGELLQALGVGVVLPLVGWYCVIGRLDRAPLDVLAPLFVLGFASNILTALPDLSADRAAKKRTWPVRRGVATAGRDAVVLCAVALLIAAQVGPPLSRPWMVVAFAPPLTGLLAALVLLRGADDAGPKRRLHFVLTLAAAGTCLQLGWAVALVFGTTQ